VRWGLFWTTILVGVCCMSGVAVADDSMLGVVGGTVQAVPSTAIRMQAETVQAVLYRDFAEYRCDFRFENTGPASTVLLGFPFELPDSGSDFAGPPIGFHAWQDGQPLPVKVSRGLDAQDEVQFYTHTAEFRTGATTITVSYIAIPTEGVADGVVTLPNGDSVQGWDTDYTYTLHSGSPWAGTIGTAVLRYSLSDAWVGLSPDDDMRERYSVQPGYDFPSAAEASVALSYTQPNTMTYQWVFKDIEPRLDSQGRSPYDLAFSFYRPSWYITPGETAAEADNEPDFAPAPDVTASSSLKVRGREAPAENLVDGDPASAWAEGAPGAGIGEHFRVTLDGTQPVAEVRILPGFARTDELFHKYNRPRHVLVHFSNGTQEMLLLKDDPSLQRFKVSVQAEWADFTIVDIYPGTTGNDTYVSEVELGEEAAPEFKPFGQLLRTAETTAAVAGASAVASAVPAAGATSATESASTGSDLGSLGPIGWALLGLVFAGAAAIFWRMTA